ncbi:MAG: transcription antitermination factor NusB [Proteobacteria bacterium]|nr:transcription antitermination factor NusB [Pseudomonadota bacterium]
MKENFSVSKRKARILIVQYIYCNLTAQSKVINFYNNDIELANSFDVFCSKFASGLFDVEYARHLSHSMLDERAQEVRAFITKYIASNWSIERIPFVVSAILHVGVFELLYTKYIDTPVIINEYVEISKFLNHKGEASFVNGILDNIAQEIRRC